MKVITVSLKRVESVASLVDDEDFAKFSRLAWHVSSNGYVVSSQPASNPRTVFLHRAILDAKPGQIVDHRDGDPLNNQKNNLRFCTHIQNCQNSRVPSNSTSGIKGVVWHKRSKKWVVRIRNCGKRIHVGSYVSKDNAAKAYMEAAKRLHGEFARW